jgi:hypothetical protein
MLENISRTSSDSRESLENENKNENEGGGDNDGSTGVADMQIMDNAI